MRTTHRLSATSLYPTTTRSHRLHQWFAPNTPLYLPSSTASPMPARLVSKTKLPMALETLKSSSEKSSSSMISQRIGFQTKVSNSHPRYRKAFAKDLISISVSPQVITSSLMARQTDWIRSSIGSWEPTAKTVNRAVVGTFPGPNMPRTPSFTGLTPFQWVLGYQPPLFLLSGEFSSVPAVDDWMSWCEHT